MKNIVRRKLNRHDGNRQSFELWILSIDLAFGFSHLGFFEI